MIKKLSAIVLLSLTLASCQSKQKNIGAGKDSNFKVEDQVVDEGSYQTIDDENQARAFNENTQNLSPVSSVETVEVQDRVFFGYDSSQVSPASAKILDVQAQWLKDNPKIRITIEGHCDERGTREYNIALGERRAVSVKSYLEGKGVESARIRTVSYGKERPAYFGTSEDVHAKNRRAVVVVN